MRQSLSTSLRRFVRPSRPASSLVRFNPSAFVCSSTVRPYLPTSPSHRSIRALTSMSLGRTFTLPTGAKIPAVGFGTFANEGSKGESYKSTITALRAGYRHLDCAWYYLNEEEIGDAIHDFLAEKKGEVKREDIFVCTKVWNHLHKPDEVKWSLQNSLDKLRLDYIDAFLVHWPIAAESTEDRKPKIGPDGKYVINKELTENPEPTWRAMEELYAEGKAKAIGVSNWTIPLLEKLLSFAKVPPHINQIEIHPFLPNDELVQWCQKHNIFVVAYSPLGSQNQVPTTGEKVNENKTLNELAQKNGHTLAQNLIAWGIRRGYAVLPKSSTPSRIESNFQDFELSDEDFATINKVAEGRHCRFVNMKDTFGYDVWPGEKDVIAS